MTDNDKERFAVAMAGAAEVLSAEITKPKLRLYFEVLQHLSIEQIERALFQAMGKCRFFPKPVEILEFSGESQANLPDKALLESSKAITALEKHGAYASVCFDDPVTMAVIERYFGGWPEFSQAIHKDGAKWVGKDFCRAYEAFARQGVQVHGHLPGISERDNALRGYEKFIQPPALVGDPEKARAVLEAGGKSALAEGAASIGEAIPAALARVLMAAKTPSNAQ